MLVRGIAVGLGIDPDCVRSPTYVLHHVYPGGRLTLHHLDLYRLGDDPDLEVLDIDAMLETGVVVVEWAGLANLGGLEAARIALASPDRDHRVVSLDSAAPERILSAFAPWSEL